MAFGKVCLLLAIFASSQINGLSMQSNKIDDEIPEDLPDDEYYEASDPKADAPCCLPDVWQGSLHSEHGISRPHRFVGECSQVFVDRTNSRIAGKKHPFGKGNFTFSYIVLFNTSDNSSQVYVFDAAKQKCLAKKFEKVHFRKACIPQNATLHGTFSLGVAGTSLSVQSWGFHHKGKRDNTDLDEDQLESGRPKPKPKPKPRRRGGFIGNLLVVPGQCIPVLIQDAGSAFGGFVGSTYFHDVQTTIKDPSVFTPPAYCKKNSTQLILGLDNTDDIIPDSLMSFLIEDV